MKQVYAKLKDAVYKCYSHSLVDHFTQVQRFVRKLSPATINDNLENGRNKSPSGLEKREEIKLKISA